MFAEQALLKAKLEGGWQMVLQRIIWEIRIGELEMAGSEGKIG